MKISCCCSLMNCYGEICGYPPPRPLAGAACARLQRETPALVEAGTEQNTLGGIARREQDHQSHLKRIGPRQILLPPASRSR